MNSGYRSWSPSTSSAPIVAFTISLVSCHRTNTGSAPTPQHGGADEVGSSLHRDEGQDPEIPHQAPEVDEADPVMRQREQCVVVEEFLQVTLAPEQQIVHPCVERAGAHLRERDEERTFSFCSAAGVGVEFSP